MTEVPDLNAEPFRPSPAERARLALMQLFLAHWRMMLGTLVLITVTVMVAWRDHIQLHVRAAWCGAAFFDYLCQGAVCYHMERTASSADATARWMPWLMATIAGSGTLWALVPWLLADASMQTLLFACLFNVLMMYCVANSPGTLGMLLVAALPLVLLDTIVLIHRESPVYAIVGFPMLIGLIVLYGLRQQNVLRAGMVAQFIAEDLARDLEVNQRRLVETERERTLLLERARLTRDMHDGLGSALVGSLVEIEGGIVKPERMAAILRECLDDLRSVIDSLEPIDHDLIALLSTLRYRFERRPDFAKLPLAWEIEDLPPLFWLGPPEALHVMRIMQEVLSNIIKHAAATQIRVGARVTGDDVEVSIMDNGRGFDPSAVTHGRGIPSLRHRAVHLGGSIHIDSCLGRGTCVRLRLPILKASKTPDREAPVSTRS